MNDTRTDSTNAGSDRSTLAHADGHPTCTCGQELDICRHAHCPRCGHRIAHPRQLVAA